MWQTAQGQNAAVTRTPRIRVDVRRIKLLIYSDNVAKMAGKD
jgi:hypothetical protein